MIPNPIYLFIKDQKSKNQVSLKGFIKGFMHGVVNFDRTPNGPQWIPAQSGFEQEKPLTSLGLGLVE